MSEPVKAINCTACGATLDVLGGHRVKSLICGYCGSVMDRHAGFQVLQRYREKPDRPFAPIGIGMTADLKGVAFTVIGMIQYVSHQSGPGWEETYDWISFQVYSPTHGYGWLTWNNGHYLFSYRTRDMPNPVMPDGLSPKSSVRLEGRIFKMFERYPAAIAYIEGEFTWVAKRGERVRVVEAIDPPFMFSYERGENALEYSMGEYMPADDVHAAFGIEPPDRPLGIHPAQPYEPGSLMPALGKVAPMFVIVAAIAFFAVTVIGGGREIVRSSTDAPSRSSLTVPFSVSNAERLIKIELTSPVINNWVYYDIVITSAQSGDDVLWLGQEISFYEGRDSDGYWSEGSHRADALFKVPASGDYEVEVKASEAGGAIPALEIRLYDQVMVKRYVVVLLILAGLAALIPTLHRKNFEKKRWADVLEDDDD
ncbi:MAG: DUF4178 domain-containing protein [Pseudomonadota bacterium]